MNVRWATPALLLAVVFVALRHGQQPPAAWGAGSSSRLALASPPVLSEEQRDENAVDFFSDKGMCAYYTLSGAFSLDNVCRTPPFKTVFQTTPDFCRGTFEVTGYGSFYEATGYVSRRGLIAACVERAAPTTKALGAGDFNRGILEVFIGQVQQQAGFPPDTPTYFHARYPQASTLLLLLEEEGSANTVTIPDDLQIYELSFLNSSTSNGYSIIWDGVAQPKTGCSGGWPWYCRGVIPQPSPGMHQLASRQNYILAFLYR